MRTRRVVKQVRAARQVWIAEERVVFVYPSGQRRPGRIAVGLPVQVDALEARCAVALEGIDPQPISIGGSSTLQALLLAAQFLGVRLHDFVAHDGRVRYPRSKSEVSLPALFGPMLRSAAAAAASTRAAAPRARAPSARGTRRRSVKGGLRERG